MNKITLNEQRTWWKPFKTTKLNIKCTASLLKKNKATLGQESIKLEKILQKMLGVRHVILTNSGTSALFMATLLSQVHKRKKIYSPAINWPGSINGALYAGKKLHLIDAQKNYINANYDNILNKINGDDLLFMTHLNGKPAYNNKNILKVWKKKKFFLIEDSAQSFMVKDFQNKFLGTRFDVGCFSLGITKICNMIYGGFCATNKSKYAKLLKQIRNNGVQNTEQKPNGIGGNFKPSDLHSVIGLNSVKNFFLIKKKLIKIYKLYKEKLNNKNIKIFDYKLNNNEIPTYIEILCDQRRKLIKYLKKNRIETSFSTRLLNLSKRFVVSNKISNAKYFDERLLRLPCGPGYSLEKIKNVIEILNKFNLK
jgi:dTDP-4-amino-4,6-dideoxygalactose transaminase